MKARIKIQIKANYAYLIFSYVSGQEMIQEAERLRESLNMPGYPREGYIVDHGDMLIINLSEAENEVKS